jgi:hypothetical protein
MSNATDIILQSITIDPTKINDVQTILKDCRTPESKIEALRNYCSHTLQTCLAIETEVVQSVVQNASWTEVVAELEEKYGVRGPSEIPGRKLDKFLDDESLN